MVIKDSVPSAPDSPRCVIHDPDDDELHAGRDPSAGTESRGEFHASVVTP